MLRAAQPADAMLSEEVGTEVRKLTCEMSHWVIHWDLGFRVLGHTGVEVTAAMKRK